jgi:hypothetical protein
MQTYTPIRTGSTRGFSTVDPERQGVLISTLRIAAARTPRNAGTFPAVPRERAADPAAERARSAQVR